MREIRVIVDAMTAQIEYGEEQLRNEADEKKRAYWLAYLGGVTYWRSELQKILAAENVGKLNLNTATLTELAELPGVGTTLATRIIGYRERVGRIRLVGELTRIPGIGVGMFRRLVQWVYV